MGKAYIEWLEPLPIGRRQLLPRLRAGLLSPFAVTMAAIWSALILLYWKMAGQRVPLADALAIALFGPVICMGLPCLRFLAQPARVRISEDGILISSQGLIRYRRIRQAELGEVEVKGSLFTVLYIVDDKRRLSQIGLSSKVSPDVLQTCLEERGVAVVRRAI